MLTRTSQLRILRIALGLLMVTALTAAQAQEPVTQPILIEEEAVSPTPEPPMQEEPPANEPPQDLPPEPTPTPPAEPPPPDTDPTPPELEPDPVKPLPTPQPTPSAPRPQAANRPNIIVIVTDDQPANTLGRFMPKTQQQLFDRGATFSRAYVTTPACCPSRISMLTGLYAHRHGLTDTSMPLLRDTAIPAIKGSGYRTAHIGKFIKASDGSPRPEYDFWVGMIGGRSPYFAPQLNVQGTLQRESGYITTILERYATSFIDDSVKRGQPFLLWFAPNAPHNPFTPERHYRNYYLRRPLPMNGIVARTTTGKPRWVKERAQITLHEANRAKRVDLLRRLQLATLLSVDDSVGRILDSLERHGITNDTVVIYTSDNGLFWGEHFIAANKEAPYEPAVRVPLGIRYPKAISARVKSSHLVANIDIGATLYELTGVTPPEQLDGLSLLGLLNGSVQPRHTLLLEGARTVRRPLPWQAIISGNYKYILNRDDIDELYDLARDPYERRNLVRFASHQPRINTLRAEIKALAGSPSGK